MALIRTSALDALAGVLSGYSFHVDKSTDSTAKRLPVENFFPFRFSLQEIGAWDMATTLSTTVNVSLISEVICGTCLTIIDNDLKHHSANSLYDSYFHGQNLQVANVAFPSSVLSEALSHNHTMAARNAPTTAGFQGRAISVQTEINKTSGIITLRHNMPGAYDSSGTSFAQAGQLTNFNGLTLANRGYILLLRTIV